MAILEILHYPDERLKLVSEEVTNFDQSLHDFIADLDETRLNASGCVGIAAPQVNYFQRIAIVDVSNNPKHKSQGLLVLINPKIVESSGKKKGREGCLSVPDYTGNVIRAKKIVVESVDKDGQPQRHECEGFEARAVLHEIDHLDGLLFVDRLVSRRNDLFERKNYQE